jgi:hypothetical protein
MPLAFLHPRDVIGETHLEYAIGGYFIQNYDHRILL